MESEGCVVGKNSRQVERVPAGHEKRRAAEAARRRDLPEG
jgi:hypothetical protein